MSKEIVLINSENATSVANMLLYGVNQFNFQRSEVIPFGSSDLRWEMASKAHLNLFLSKCIDAGLNSVACFGHLAEFHKYPIAVPEDVDVSECTNEVWDDFNFEMEVRTHYWNQCMAMYDKYLEKEIKGEV